MENTKNPFKKFVVLMAMLAPLVFLQIQGCGSAGSSTTENTPSGQGTNSGTVIQNTRSGTITMQFKNQATVSSSQSAGLSFDANSSGANPTFFGMKIIAAYLAEDVDPVTQNNIGQTFMFYLNADCQEDIMHCDISGGTAEDGNPMDKIIGTNNYFDLTDPALANSELNDQTQDVRSGNYQYARMEFCKYNSGSADNVEWEYTGVPRRSFRTGQCGVTSAKIVPAVSIPGNAAVTFVASYTTVGSVQVGDGAQGEDCTTDTNGTKVCFNLPIFTPEIIVQ